ncbi:MAG: YkgJ family cysteine cluster protein [Bacteroidota bacterium]
MNLDAFRKQAQDRRKPNKVFLKRLKKRPPKHLDQQVQELHDEVFEELDCLDCANCCKTTSPIFLPKDIERLARHFRQRPAEFIEQHLYLDKEGDYVLHQAPCPFLGPDNYCSVYESRPRACREYPHTNRKRFQQILDLTYRNTQVCPAVLEIVERLKAAF